MTAIEWLEGNAYAAVGQVHLLLDLVDGRGSGNTVAGSLYAMQSGSPRQIAEAEIAEAAIELGYVVATPDGVALSQEYLDGTDLDKLAAYGWDGIIEH